MNRSFLPWVVSLFSISPLFSLSGYAQDLIADIPFTNGRVNVLKSQNDTLYMGGNFSNLYLRDSTSSYGAALSPCNFSTNGNKVSVYGSWPKPNGPVYTTISDGMNGFYIGGNFTSVGDSARGRIAHIDSNGIVTSRFSGLGANDTVKTISFTGDTVFIGGSFSGVGKTYGHNIAAIKLSDSSFRHMPITNGTVYSIEPDGEGGWFIGGYFNIVNNEKRKNLARIDSNGNLLPWLPETDNIVYAITTWGDSVFIGGEFEYVNGAYHRSLSVLSKTSGAVYSWNTSTVYGTVYALSIKNGFVYIGGSFNSIGSNTRNNIARLSLSNAALNSWNPSASATVKSIILTGSTVFVGGGFSSIGGQLRKGLAALDVTTGLATSWNTSSTANYYSDIVLAGNTLYAAASGFPICKVYAFDTTYGNTIWSSASLDNSESIYCLAVSNNSVYIAGNFTSVGGIKRNRFASFDAANGTLLSWEPNVPPSSIYSIATSNGILCFGGNFTSVGGVKRNFLAAIKVSSNTLLGWDPSPNAVVKTIAVVNNTCFAGGYFTSLGGQTRNYVGAVNLSSGAATSWNAQLSNGPVNVIYPYDNKLYIGGGFTSFGGYTRNRVAAVNLNTLSLVLSFNISMDKEVTAIAASGSSIYLGGTFTTAGGQARKYIARVDSGTALLDAWSAPTSILPVTGLLVNGSNLYYTTASTASGALGVLSTTTGSSRANWLPNPPYASSFYCLAMGNVLYTGGNFTQIGGYPRSNLAAIKLSTQSILPWNPSPDNGVYAIATTDTLVYIGGDFTNVNGATRNRIASLTKFSSNPTTWNPNADSRVSKIEVTSSAIYVGGSFSNIGSTARSRLAALNMVNGGSTSWAPNPTGGVVNDLCVSGDTLFVCGTFTAISSQNRTGLVGYSISSGSLLSWNPVLNGGATCLSLYSGILYVGGTFTQVGTQSRKRLAAFSIPSGSLLSWNPSNFLGSPNALFAKNMTLYVGGTYNFFSERAGFLSTIGISSGSLLLWNPAIVSLDKNGWEDAQASVSCFTNRNNKVFFGGEFSHIIGRVFDNTAGLIETPTLQLSSVSSLGCPGTVVTIPFSTDLALTPGNNFIAQLSNLSGSFTSPINIGTKAGVSSDTITAQIPVSLVPGIYNVRIISSNPVYTSNQQTIIVRALPSLKIGINDTDQCLKGNSFIFTDSSTISTGTLSRKWSLSTGDSSSLQSYNSSIAASGIYYVKLVSTSNFGCSDSSVRFIEIYPQTNPGYTINNSSQCLTGNSFVFTDTSTIFTGSILSRQWQIAGVTDTSSASSVTRSFSSAGLNTITLFVQSDKGCRDTLAKTVTVNPQASTAFSVNDSDQCKSGNSFLFTNTSTIANGTFTNSWSFGDGNTSSGNNTSNTYNTAGSYNTKLITTTNFGCKDSLAKTIVVYPQTTISFSVNDSDQCKTGNNFVFANNSSVSSGTFTSDWAFGDNNNSSQNSPSHSYGNSSSFNVKLVTTTNYGCKDSLVKTILIYPNPTALFTADSTQCLTGNQFLMNNGSSGSPTSYHWSFGNSSTSVNTNPSVSYASAGNYSIRLVAQNSFGCNDTLVKNVRVKQNPAIPVFTYSPDTVVCDNINIVLKTGDTNTRSWIKDFSPLGVNADSLVVTNSPGSYSLKVTNTENCDAISNVANLFFKPTPVKPIVSVSGNVLTSSSTAGNQWYNNSGIISGETGQTYSASSIGQYYTIVTLNGCPSAASDVVNFPATGMASVSKNNSVSVYPNPNNGSFTIVPVQKIDGEVLVKLFDLTGRIVFEEVRNDNNLSIQTTGLANATYLLVVQTNDGLSKVKIAVFR